MYLTEERTRGEMEHNNTKKIEDIRNFFNKEMSIYDRCLRSSEREFIENIYDEILNEEWMKVVGDKLEPLKLHEKVYLINKADSLEDLMKMLIFEKNCIFNEDGSPSTYPALDFHVIGIKGGEGYLTVNCFEDYLVKKYGAEFDELIQEEIEEYKKNNPVEAEDGDISYYSIVSDIMDNPIYNLNADIYCVDAYGAMEMWIERNELDKDRLFNHFDLDIDELIESVHTVNFKKRR